MIRLVRTMFPLAVLAAAAACTTGTALARETPHPIHESSVSTHGAAAHSPGIASGNVVQIPISINANACGNALGFFVANLSPTTCAN
ncbi:chaplin [Streptomyces chartreusis]|uniref:chaplin n=1 Tax=Streptomyces chartreusis TaxID=1969 RepID=UPI002E187376